MAVLGIFMLSYTDHERIHHDKNDITPKQWQRYFDITQTLKSDGDSIVFDSNIQSLMGNDLLEFWRYEGSLTTPPCTEGIIWTIFKKPIAFLEDRFQTLRDNVYFEDYRGPQPLYNRTVYRNFFNETLSSIPDYNRCSLDSLNEKIKENSSILGVINCSTYSFFLFILFSNSMVIFLVFIFCKVRYSISRKKFE
jgi:hypothetical protein